MTEVMENVEREIETAYRNMMNAPTEAGERYWCDRLTYWVKQRSPERVAQMEREKGLV